MYLFIPTAEQGDALKEEFSELIVDTGFLTPLPFRFFIWNNFVLAITEEFKLGDFSLQLLKGSFSFITSHNLFEV